MLVNFYKYSLIKKGFILLSSLLLDDILAARLIKLEQLWGHRSIFFEQVAVAALFSCPKCLILVCYSRHKSDFWTQVSGVLNC